MQSPEPLVDGDLTLRRAVVGDVADVRSVYAEPDIRRRMLWDDAPPDEAEALANIERSERAWDAGTAAPFRVIVDGHVVGGVNLILKEHDTAEASYFLRASARGRGLGTRGLLLAVDWGFREVGLARIFLRADPDNAASLGVAERAGFTYEGLERQSAAYGDGRRFDSRVYSILPSERVSLRLATDVDVDFLVDTAMAATADQGRATEDADLLGYRTGFVEWTAAQVRGEVPHSETSVVTAYGVAVGRLRVVRTADVVELAGLQLLAAHQSRGIGARVVRDLMAEALSAGRRFELSVHKDNPRAQAFYHRLGLRVVGETDTDLVMRG